MPKYLITYARKFQLLTETDTEGEAIELVNDLPEIGQDCCETVILDVYEIINGMEKVVH
jgi:hypothetical protein